MRLAVANRKAGRAYTGGRRRVQALVSAGAACQEGRRRPIVGGAREEPLDSGATLFIVAGYPTSGKTTLLRKAVKERIALFGEAHSDILPRPDQVQGIDEQSDTRAKLEAGFWVTLRDLPELNREPPPPRGLLLHLDLLLTVLIFERTQDAPSLSEAEQALNALFAQPALRHYGRCAACTVQAPIEEVQARWRRRYPQGLDPSADPLLARKDRLITDATNAASVFAVLHRAWHNHLLRLERSGRLLCNREARLSLRGAAAIPVIPSALPAFPRST